MEWVDRRFEDVEEKIRIINDSIRKLVSSLLVGRKCLISGGVFEGNQGTILGPDIDTGYLKVEMDNGPIGKIYVSNIDLENE